MAKTRPLTAALHSALRSLHSNDKFETLRGYGGAWLGGGGGAYFADFEADEAADGDVFAKVGDGLGDHFADGDAFVLDVVLFVEAVFLVEFFHFAGGDFVHDGFGFAGGQGLGFVDFAFLLQHFGRDFFAADIARIQRGDVHGDVVGKLL